MKVSVFIIFDADAAPGGAAYARAAQAGKRAKRPNWALRSPHSRPAIGPRRDPVALWSNGRPRPGRRRESVKDNRQRPGLRVRVKAYGQFDHE